MNDFSPEPEQEVSVSAKSSKQKIIVLAAILIAAIAVLVVLKQIKPVSLHNQQTLAAPVINLSWSLQEPDNTISSKIYRTTTTFLGAPDDGSLIASVTAPTATYADTNVSGGVDYYYSIFEFDPDGNAFDPSYFILSPTDSTPQPAPDPQPQPSPQPQTLPDLSNFKCSDSATVYVYYHGHKEVYPEAPVFFAWNNSFSNIQVVSPSVCATVPGSDWVRLPENALIKVSSGPTVWMTEGTTARPVASLSALYRISANPKIITVSLSYLHTYSGGAVIK